ncbi:MAG TPA: hypothetical protein VGC18_13745 [Lacisediminihabitans sp.]|uniref:hypothetical protein n=1 Tax=Lacisediminihabitans sp. TaxID=2787631 RepID=UPI002ED999B3
MTITTAMLSGDARQNVESIKAEVISTLTDADPDVRIRKTDYFNHTFAPDLLLSWPKERVERQVYLRTTGDANYLLEDLGLMDEKSSIMMPLGETSPAREADRAEVLNTGPRRRALIASPQSFGALASDRSQRPVVGLASRALLQGGVGFVGEESAREFSSNIDLGFEAAQRGESEQTGIALSSAETVLDNTRYRQVGEFLSAVWIGSGALSSEFPGGEAGATSVLTASALEVLLDTVDLDDPLFWKRVGKNLTMDKLRYLEVSTDHENFQRLIQSTASLLKVHALRIIDEPIGEPNSARWFASGGELGLRLGATTILLTGGSVESFTKPGAEAAMVIPTLRSRAEQHEITVSDLTIDAGGRRIEYSAADDSSVTNDSQLTAIEAALGSRASVTNASIAAGSSQVRVDFRSSTAFGLRRATFYMSQLVMSSVPLLLALTARSLDSLIAAVGASVATATIDHSELE